MNRVCGIESNKFSRSKKFSPVIMDLPGEEVHVQTIPEKQTFVVCLEANDRRNEDPQADRKPINSTLQQAMAHGVWKTEEAEN